MYYYLFYKDGIVVGYNCSKTPLNSPSYKEVTEEEFLEHVGSVPVVLDSPTEELEKKIQPVMDDTDAMLVDHELRLSMVELGLDPNDESEV